MRTVLIALALFGCCCGYEGDDMAGHNFLVDNVQFKEAKPGCWAFLSSDQTMATGGWRKIEFDDEVYDYGGCWDTSNHKYTVIAPGLYNINCRALGQDLDAGDVQWLLIYKNGASASIFEFETSHTDSTDQAVRININMPLAKGDYIEMYYQQTNGGDIDLASLYGFTFIQIQLIEG